MAGYKPGRLARTLGLTGSGPFFGLYSSTVGGLYDEQINAATIHRGKSGRGGGVHPSTLEITVPGLPALDATGSSVRLFLREVPAARLAARLGTTGPAIERRFTGRLGQVDVEDTGKRFSTSYSAASWISRLNYAPARSTPTAGQSVKRVIADLLTLNRPAPLAGIEVTFHGEFDAVATTSEPVTFKDAIGTYTADLGILIRETRAGVSQVLSLPYRLDYAQRTLAAALPLTRSQAISPAKWAQRNEWPPVIVDYDVTNENGARVTRTAQIENTTGESPERLALDWSYIHPTTDQLYQHAYGMVYESSPRQYTVPSVKIDLLHLIASPKQYHRDQAGQLLRMEAGDPVYFSGDWPARLRGVHFAEGITETIGPDEWTLDLSLVPYSHAMGSPNNPAVPARVWDSAGNTWNTETRKWSES